MTNPNLTLVGFLVDRSGSMASIKSDTEGGLSSFVKEQQESLAPGEQIETWLAEFDNEYTMVHKEVPVADFPEYTLHPRGMTALMDSMYRFIQDIGSNLEQRPEEERPGKVMIVTLTDGMENSSREVTATVLKDAVRDQEERYSWDFVFLGANIDAVEVGAQFGMKAGKSMTYGANASGVASTFSAVSRYTQTLRAASAPSDVAFEESERVEAMGDSN